MSIPAGKHWHLQSFEGFGMQGVTTCRTMLNTFKARLLTLNASEHIDLGIKYDPAIGKWQCLRKVHEGQNLRIRNIEVKQ